MGTVNLCLIDFAGLSFPSLLREFSLAESFVHAIILLLREQFSPLNPDFSKIIFHYAAAYRTPRVCPVRIASLATLGRHRSQSKHQ